MAAAGGEALTGIILKSAPIGEYDRRLEILTRERGRISAFARGARKPGSPLMAAASPFVFGKFRVFFGRSSNQLLSAEVEQYFEDLRTDLTRTCYASYFMEILEFCTAENTDSAGLMILAYQALRALASRRFEPEFVRCVFEIKAVMLEGEYQDLAQKDCLEATRYTLEYLLRTPPAGIFTFVVSQEVLRELQTIAQKLCARSFPRHFASLDILEVVAK